jgi:hypothetical protein
VELTVEDDDEARRLALSGIGGSWAERWERLEHSVDAWSVGA